MRFLIQRESDDSFTVYLNTEYLCYVNHDEHGRDGMALAEKMIARMAKILNFKIEDEWV